MALELTIVCDLCSTVGAGGQTAAAVRDDVKGLGWCRIRVDGSVYDVCNVCVRDKGGANAVRKMLRSAAPATPDAEGRGR